MAPTSHGRLKKSPTRVLSLGFAIVQAGCAFTRTAASPMTKPLMPHFLARVVSACREAGRGPTIGWYSQVNLIVAIPPATVGNAGIIVASQVPVSIRHETRPSLATTADSFATGDELEVWHDGTPAIRSAQSPQGTPTYHATKIVLLPRTEQASSHAPGASLMSCHFEPELPRSERL